MLDNHSLVILAPWPPSSMRSGLPSQAIIMLGRVGATSLIKSASLFQASSLSAWPSSGTHPIPRGHGAACCLVPPATSMEREDRNKSLSTLALYSLGS